MIEIYRKSFRFARESWITLLFLAVVKSGIYTLTPNSVSGGVSGFLLDLIAVYYMHLRILPAPQKICETLQTLKITSFTKLGYFSVLVAIIILLPNFLIELAPYNFSVLRQYRKQWELPVYFCLLLTSFSMFGTALPAAIDRNPRYSLWMGMKMTGRAMWRLLLGAGLCSTVFYASIHGLASAHEHMTAPMPLVATFLEAIAINLVGLFPAIVGVATLCHVYRMIVPAPDGAVHA